MILDAKLSVDTGYRRSYVSVARVSVIEEAMSDQAFEQRFSNFYTKKGQEPTEDQWEICRTVTDLHSHFTVEQLREKVRGIRSSLPDGIVAKTLEEMVGAGLIRKVFFGGDIIYYEHVWGHLHHDHLWCIDCHKVIEFHDDQIEFQQERIAREKGFTILRHHLQLIGLCDECKGKAPEYDLEYHDHHHAQPSMPLAMVPDGESVVVKEILGSRGMRHRLAEMGFVKGQRIGVIQNRFAGPFIIDVKGTRLGIAHKLAHHILIEKK